MKVLRKRFLRWIVRESMFTSFWVLEFSISDNNFIVLDSSNAAGNQLDSTWMTSQINSLKGNITVTLFFVSQSLEGVAHDVRGEFSRPTVAQGQFLGILGTL